jgi:hypothetical protein
MTSSRPEETVFMAQMIKDFAVEVYCFHFLSVLTNVSHQLQDQPVSMKGFFKKIAGFKTE